MSSEVPQDGVTDGPGGRLSLQQPGGAFTPWPPTVLLPQVLGSVPGVWCRSWGVRCWGSLVVTLQLSLVSAGTSPPRPKPAQSHPTALAARDGPRQPCREMPVLHSADAAQSPFGAEQSPAATAPVGISNSWSCCRALGYGFCRDGA